MIERLKIKTLKVAATVNNKKLFNVRKWMTARCEVCK